MKRGENWMLRLAEGMDLPEQTLPGVPLVEICGNGRVLIENHMGISVYEPDKICVKVSYGQVSVQGKCLELAKMTRGQLIICGRVDCVSLIRKVR